MKHPLTLKATHMNAVTLALGLALGFTGGNAVWANDLMYPTIVRSADGSVVHDAYGECWGTGAGDMSATPTLNCGQHAPAPKAEAPKPVAAAPAPAPAPAPTPAPVMKHDKIVLSADALFDFNKAVLKPAGKEHIDSELAKADRSGGLDSIKSVKVVGYTDSIGTEKYNQKLSQHRAEAVKAYLVSKGVAANKIDAEGRGEKDPVASNKTKEGRAQNRRAEITIEN